MGMNFPNSPVPGQVYTPLSGYSYVFLDGVWRIVQDAKSILTADTRNRIVNGAMQISQENGDTAASNNGFYMADQWLAIHAGAAVVSSGRATAQSTRGSPYRIRQTVTTPLASLAASDHQAFRQFIEGTRIADFQWGTPNAKPIVVRFSMAAAVGVYTFTLRNSPATHRYACVVNIPTANVWFDFVFAIPGPTVGTWSIDNTVGIEFGLAFAAGSTYTVGSANTWEASTVISLPGATNGVATNGNVFLLADVGLYLDPLATGAPPRWQMPDEAEELQACQRYYEVSAGYGAFYCGNATSGAIYYGNGGFKETKRVAPAITYTTGSQLHFPTTAGAGLATTQYHREARTANATGNGSFFHSTFEANARM